MERNTSSSPQRKKRRPEAITGAVLLSVLLILLGIGFAAILPSLTIIVSNTLYLTILLVILAAIAFVIFDPKMRALVWYLWRSVVRWITGLFVTLDPIAVLRNYTDELENNIKGMTQQMGKLRGQMHKLQEQIFLNKKQIESNLELASQAKAEDKRSVMILKSRKAGRLRESNMRLEDLYKKMEILYRTLVKMRENSTILVEDIKDQVEIKEQERKAIHASYGAIESARSIIQGNPDKRAMFDAAMEAVKDDVAEKVGEMEQFMEVSSSFMESIDLQNGIFEEEGLQMLEEWEKKSSRLLLDEEKMDLINQANDDKNVLDLNQPIQEPVRQAGHKNQYDSFFE